MAADVSKLLAAALGTFASLAAAAAPVCRYPDEGTMPLHRAVTRVKLLPETEAWARIERKDGVVVQYALLLEDTRREKGRCYWAVEARAQGKVWRRFYITPDGRHLFVAGRP
jgi:hypothetical protein